MTMPDPYHAWRRLLLDRSSITDLLLPQDSLPSLATAPIFAYGYPRKVAGDPATGYTGHDWAALLKARAVRMVLITPSGRVRSGGDTSRAAWSRPRADVQCYGRTESEAGQLRQAIEEYLKQVSRVRAVLSTGTALIHDVTVEGGPISFPDPETDAPVEVGIYAASVAEEFVEVA